MLLGRGLEARDASVRTGVSGWRLFAFTDTIDVLNRLFWDLQDAESNNLAALRSGDDAKRDAAGQTWSRLTHAVERPLDIPLQVARTSSKDAGVDASADVVVASASLEVGFDDPGVGAVLQHKAPRDVASFVQRKGRAGRTRTMRPWTVTVLSDYGRDRVAYQGYERLIEPIVPARSLPVDNLHVLKMQASFALLDWLSIRVEGLRAPYHLSAPSRFPGVAPKQQAAARELRRTLLDEGTRQSLERYIRWALGGLDDRTLTSVLWRQPRPILTDAVPRLLRRLDTNWSSEIPGREERQRFGNPLPECLPDSLFSDLNLPEVLVRAAYPDSWADRHPEEEGRPIASAISECIPGNPTRRYAQRLKAYYHWIEPITSLGNGVMIDGALATWDELGSLDSGGRSVRLVRPWTMHLQPLRDQDARGRSARPAWESQIEASAPGHSLTLPAGTAGSHAIENICFHTHSLYAPLTVARAATGVKVSSTDGTLSTFELELQGDKVAIGYREQADGILVRFSRNDIPTSTDISDTGLRAARGEFLRQQYASSTVLPAHASSFQIEWLRELHVGALAALSLASEPPRTLVDVTPEMLNRGIGACLKAALEGIFGVVPDDSVEQRGAREIRDLLDDHEVCAEIGNIAQRLVDVDEASLDQIIANGHISTLAVALREAYQTLCPRTDAENLVIDIVEDNALGPVAWFVEQEVGGGGTVEEIFRSVNEDPTRLSQLLKSSLGPSDLELVDVYVRRVLASAEIPASSVTTAFAMVRNAQGAIESAGAIDGLRDALSEIGVPPTHEVISSLIHRVLRPGSDHSTDDLLRSALQRWTRGEEALGLELDARAIAYAVSADNAEPWKLEQIYSLLWPRGRAARAARLDGWSRFGDLGWVERLVAQPSVKERPMELPASVDLQSATAALATTGVIDLVSESDRAEVLTRAVTTLLTTQIDVGSVLAYPRLRGASTDGNMTRATLELPEALR